MQRLLADIYCVGLGHDRKRDLDEGVLVAGALIRALQPEKNEKDVWFFQASTDGGRTWYWQRSYERPPIK